MTFGALKRKPPPASTPPWVEFVGGPLHWLRVRALEDGFPDWWDGVRIAPPAAWKPALLQVALDLPAEFLWISQWNFGVAWRQGAPVDAERYCRVFTSENRVIYSWKP